MHDTLKRILCSFLLMAFLGLLLINAVSNLVFLLFIKPTNKMNFSHGNYYI